MSATIDPAPHATACVSAADARALRDRLDTLIGARAFPAQVCVVHRGRTIVDQAYDSRPGALFWPFSACKPLTAVLVWSLVERGLIDLDEPMARHWPELSGHGKDTITARHVLQHRSGLPTAGSQSGDVAAMADWSRSLARLERARCLTEPGAAVAYQFLTYGFLLGGLVERVTGRSFAECLTEYVLEPLDLRATHAVLPPGAHPQPFFGRGTRARLTAAVVNRPQVRRAVIPSGGTSTTAPDLAAFYTAMLRIDDTAPGPISPDTLAQMCEQSVTDERDAFLKTRVPWAQGFQLGGDRFGSIGSMGRLSSRSTFGHNGSNVCLAWADPDRDVVLAYLTAGMTTPVSDMRHLAEVSDTVLEWADHVAGVTKTGESVTRGTICA